VTDPKRYTLDEVTRIVNGIMVDEFEAEEAKLAPNAKLNEDLGLDSLDGVDMVVAIEKAFTCRIGEEEAKSIRTLGDVYDQVMKRLGAVGQLEGATPSEGAA